MLRNLTVLTAMLATAIAVAACGGSGSPKASSSAQASTSNRLKMARCIRSHGVPDFPDPSSGLNLIRNSRGSTSVDGVNLNVSPQTLQKAMATCQKYAPQGPPISGAQLAKIRRGALAMAECMRSHGVANFPDPQVATGPGGHGIGVRIGVPPGSSGALNPNSPAFQRAQKTCMPLMGAFGPKAQKVGK